MQFLDDNLPFVASWKPFLQLLIHWLQYILYYTIMQKHSDKHNHEGDKKK